MWFVRGLTSNHKEVLINPEQVLYIHEVRGKKSAIVLAHHPGRLILDQGPSKVQELFDEFLEGFIDADKGTTELLKLLGGEQLAAAEASFLSEDDLQSGRQRGRP